MADYKSDAARRKQTGLWGALETDPEAPGLSMIEAALMAAGGPIAGAVRRAPMTAGLSTGLLSSMGGLNESEAQQAKAKANSNVPADIRAMASKLPAELQGRYIDLSMRAKAGGLPRADRETLNQLTGIIANSATGANVAEQKRLMDAGLRAEEARQKVLRDAPKSFQERFGDAASYTPIAPLLAAMGTTLPVAGVGAMGARRAASQWTRAAEKGLAATDAPTMANASSLANAYEKKFPEPSAKSALAPYAIPAAIGGLEGMGIANIPDEWNASLPPENPERKAFEAYLKELPEDHPDYARAKRIYDSLPTSNPARDASISYFSDPGKVIPKTLIGALQGAGGGVLATTIGKWLAPSEKGLPRAQTAALRERVSGSGMEGATKALRAEADAMGTVLPLPPERPQLPGITFADAPPRPLPGSKPQALPPPSAPPAAGYDPLAVQAARLKGGQGNSFAPQATAEDPLAFLDFIRARDPTKMTQIQKEGMALRQKFEDGAFAQAKPGLLDHMAAEGGKLIDPKMAGLTAAVGGGATAGDVVLDSIMSAMQGPREVPQDRVPDLDPETLIELVKAGKLPHSVLRDLLPTPGR